MEVDDCYRELGVAPGASDAEVKAAWRRLAAQWHPDRNASPQALHKIQRINRALDGIRKAKADAPQTQGQAADAAVDVAVHLTVEEVAAGCTRELRGEVPEQCAECAGTGLQAHPVECDECGGSGRVRQPLWFAWALPGECGACRGKGATRPGCSHCAASGKTARKYRCRVQLPPGMRAGERLDVAADVQGRRRKHQLMLRLRVELRHHAFFSVEEDGMVSCELPVDGFAWIANRWVEVPTPHGPRQMRLRRGTLNYRIQAAGLPWRDNGGCADCIVTVVPLFPESFDGAQDAAIDGLIASNSEAEGSAAAQRMAAWKQAMARWRAQTAGEAA